MHRFVAGYLRHDKNWFEGCRLTQIKTHWFIFSEPYTINNSKLFRLLPFDCEGAEWIKHLSGGQLKKGQFYIFYLIASIVFTWINKCEALNDPYYAFDSHSGVSTIDNRTFERHPNNIITPASFGMEGPWLLSCEPPYKLINVYQNSYVYSSCFMEKDLGSIPLWTVHALEYNLFSDSKSIRPSPSPWLHYEDGSLGGNGKTYSKGWDRGHFVPRSDFGSNSNLALSTFIVVNRAPQKAEFNQYGWRAIESTIRSYAREKRKTFLVITAITPGTPELPISKTIRTKVPARPVPKAKNKKAYEKARALGVYKGRIQKKPFKKHTSPGTSKSHAHDQRKNTPSRFWKFLYDPTLKNWIYFSGPNETLKKNATGLEQLGIDQFGSLKDMDMKPLGLYSTLDENTLKEDFSKWLKDKSKKEDIAQAIKKISHTGAPPICGGAVKLELELKAGTVSKEPFDDPGFISVKVGQLSIKPNNSSDACSDSCIVMQSDFSIRHAKYMPERIYYPDDCKEENIKFSTCKSRLTKIYDTVDENLKIKILKEISKNNTDKVSAAKGKTVATVDLSCSYPIDPSDEDVDTPGQ